MAESFVITTYIFKITGEKWRGIRVEYKTVCERLLAFFPLVDKNGIGIFTRTCNRRKEFDFCWRYEKEIGEAPRLEVNTGGPWSARQQEWRVQAMGEWWPAFIVRPNSWFKSAARVNHFRVKRPPGRGSSAVWKCSKKPSLFLLHKFLEWMAHAPEH